MPLFGKKSKNNAKEQINEKLSLSQQTNQQANTTKTLPLYAIVDEVTWWETFTHYMNWAHDKFYDFGYFLSNLYPKSWKKMNTDQFTPEEWQIYNRQNQETRKRMKLSDDLRERKKLIHSAHASDTKFLENQQTLFKNWYKITETDINNKKEASEGFTPHHDSDYKNLPDWVPQEIDRKQAKNQLCQTFQCTQTDLENFLVTPGGYSFEQKLKIVELSNKNLESENKIEDLIKKNNQLQGQLDQCVIYATQQNLVSTTQNQEQNQQLEQKTKNDYTSPEGKYNIHSLEDRSIFYYISSFLGRLISFLVSFLVAISAFPFRILSGDIGSEFYVPRGPFQRHFVTPAIRFMLFSYVMYLYFIVVKAVVNCALTYLPVKEREDYRRFREEYKDYEKFQEDFEDYKKYRENRDKNSWQKIFGALSKVITISRGGNLVPIEQIDIDTFSASDLQQVEQFFQHIGIVKFEIERQKMEKLLVDQNKNIFQRKLSKIPLGRVMTLKRPVFSEEAKAILIGISIFATVGFGDPLPGRGRRLSDFAFTEPTSFVSSSIQELSEDWITETSEIANDQVPITTEISNESLSDLESKIIPKRVPKKIRKPAKTVTLSDLSPLDNVDQEDKTILEAYPSSRGRSIQLSERIITTR